MVTYALVSSTLTKTGTEEALTGAVLRALPMTVGNRVRLDADNTIQFGEATATYQADGQLMTNDDSGVRALRIPLGIDPPDVLWNFSLLLPGGGTEPLGMYPVTASVNCEDLIDFSQTAVSATLLATLASLVADAEAAAAAAQASATQAASYGGGGGGGGGLTVVDNGNGTLTVTSGTGGTSSLVDNGNGTLTLT